MSEAARQLLRPTFRTPPALDKRLTDQGDKPEPWAELRDHVRDFATQNELVKGDKFFMEQGGTKKLMEWFGKNHDEFEYQEVKPTTATQDLLY